MNIYLAFRSLNRSRFSEMRPIVAYLRVSTGKQARSGLGVEAQCDAVHRFADAEGYSIVEERVEVETGKGADALDRRPQLAAALEHARKRKCSIVVAQARPSVARCGVH